MHSGRCAPWKVVILADSLALPRGKAAGDVPYEATYPFLLGQSLRNKLGSFAPWVIERGQRRRTIRDVLADWHEQVELVQAQAVVVHVGVVDCAPRVFLPLERKIVERLRPIQLRDLVLRLVNQHRGAIIRRFPNRVYVPYGQFERGVEEVVSRAHHDGLQALVFVNIVMPPYEIESRSPGFRRNVEKYNHALQAQTNREGVQVVDLNELIEHQDDSAAMLIEGIHLARAGHRMLAEQLEACIVQQLENAVPAVSISPW